MNVRLGDIKDPIKYQMQKSDTSAVANNAKAASATANGGAEIVNKQQDGQGDKAVNKALQQALNPSEAIFTNPLYNATAARTTVLKEDKKSAYEKDKARFENKDIGELLSKGDSASSTLLVSYYKAPIDKTRTALDDKYLPQRFKKEREGALLAFSSGIVTSPNSKKTELKDLEDVNKYPLATEKGQEKETFISYTLGKVKNVFNNIAGEKLNFVS